MSGTGPGRDQKTARPALIVSKTQKWSCPKTAILTTSTGREPRAEHRTGTVDYQKCRRTKLTVCDVGMTGNSWDAKREVRRRLCGKTVDSRMGNTTHYIKFNHKQRVSHQLTTFDQKQTRHSPEHRTCCGFINFKNESSAGSTAAIPQVTGFVWVDVMLATL
jgi:hypothetical protein